MRRWRTNESMHDSRRANIFLRILVQNFKACIKWIWMDEVVKSVWMRENKMCKRSLHQAVNDDDDPILNTNLFNDLLANISVDAYYQEVPG